MLNIGWTELLVIAALAIIVVGPKDLPRVLHGLGQWVARGRAIMREFQGGIEDMVRETELDKLKEDFEAAGDLDITAPIENGIDPTGASAHPGPELGTYDGDDAAPENLDELAAERPGKDGT